MPPLATGRTTLTGTHTRASPPRPVSTTTSPSTDGLCARAPRPDKLVTQVAPTARRSATPSPTYTFIWVLAPSWQFERDKELTETNDIGVCVFIRRNAAKRGGLLTRYGDEVSGLPEPISCGF